ncbi:MAG: histidinol-phosphate transaminase [Christensenellaceae bacterium]|jgi:histidinol-phosphate aminotransferase|nr:histidinol-phosphate transaminase [Christensenellaceae bacterium]
MSRFLSARFAALQAYTPGEQPQDMAYTKLNTNESPYPPSPGVFAALSSSEIARLQLYPDPEGKRLRAKLAARYGVSPQNVLLANGSDEILNFAFMAFCDSATPVIFPDISYGFYPVYARLYGLSYKTAPLKEDFTIDPKHYGGNDATVVLANPNAPTGIALSLEQIEAILKANPDHIVLVDEAYVDFGAQSALPLLGRYDNLLIAQTFSKSRSLAGARLGFALASEDVIADLDTIRYSTNPYNLNRLTLLAGEAAVEDAAYYEANAQTIIQTRAYTAAALRELGFALTNSKANFLFASHPALPGGALYRRLKELGVLVRHFGNPRIQNYVRITVGTQGQMDTLLACVRRILTEQ